MKTRLLISLLVVLLASFVAGRTPLGNSPQCGGYTPANWINDGETAQITTSNGSPMSFYAGASLFGCTPVSATSSDRSQTVAFTYFDSSAPNNNLVSHSLCNDGSCGNSEMDYDDSQGGGKLALLSSVNYQTSVETFVSEDGLIREMDMVINPDYELIGQVETHSKSVRARRSPGSLLWKVFQLISPEATFYASKIQYFYFASSTQMLKQLFTFNFTSDADSGPVEVDYSYSMNPNGDIIQIAWSLVHGVTYNVYIKYDENREVTQICVDSCDDNSGTYQYDSSGRLTGESSNGTQISSYEYNNNGQIVSADFGSNSQWTFNY